MQSYSCCISFILCLCLFIAYAIFLKYITGCSHNLALIVHTAFINSSPAAINCVIICFFLCIHTFSPFRIKFYISFIHLSNRNNKCKKTTDSSIHHSSTNLSLLSVALFTFLHPCTIYLNQIIEGYSLILQMNQSLQYNLYHLLLQNHTLHI